MVCWKIGILDYIWVNIVKFILNSLLGFYSLIKYEVKKIEYMGRVI